MSVESLRAHSGETFVIKVGGEVASDAHDLDVLLSDVAALRRAGVRCVLMHGGGPQATELSTRLGLEPKMVGGRRITDFETLQIMKMILGGQVNVDLVAACEARGIDAVGLSGPSGKTIQARRRPPKAVSGSGGEKVDFGWVGDIVAIAPRAIHTLLDAGFVPVLSSLGVDDEGHVYNINADTAANAVAIALRADKLMLLTGAPGVLQDKDDPTSRIPRLTIARARAAIADGRVQGGMIPKLEESIASVEQGVRAIHIFKGGQPGALLAEVEAPGSAGTQLEP